MTQPTTPAPGRLDRLTAAQRSVVVDLYLAWEVKEHDVAQLPDKGAAPERRMESALRDLPILTTDLRPLMRRGVFFATLSGASTMLGLTMAGPAGLTASSVIYLVCGAMFWSTVRGFLVDYDARHREAVDKTTATVDRVLRAQRSQKVHDDLSRLAQETLGPTADLGELVNDVARMPVREVLGQASWSLKQEARRIQLADRPATTPRPGSPRLPASVSGAGPVTGGERPPSVVASVAVAGTPARPWDRTPVGLGSLNSPPVGPTRPVRLPMGAGQGRGRRL